MSTWQSLLRIFFLSIDGVFHCMAGFCSPLPAKHSSRKQTSLANWVLRMDSKLKGSNSFRLVEGNSWSFLPSVIICVCVQVEEVIDVLGVRHCRDTSKSACGTRMPPERASGIHSGFFGTHILIVQGSVA